MRAEEPSWADKNLDLCDAIEVSGTLRRTSNTKARQENLSDAVIDR